MHFQLVEPPHPDARRRGRKALLHLPPTPRFCDEKRQQNIGDQAEDGTVEHGSGAKSCALFQSSFGAQFGMRAAMKFRNKLCSVEEHRKPAYPGAVDMPEQWLSRNRREDLQKLDYALQPTDVPVSYTEKRRVALTI